MKTIENYLDEIKEITGSDYQTAYKMGVDRAVISKIRKRSAVSDENAVKMAELLGIDPGEILLAAAMARSEGKVKEAWASVGKRAGIAASLIMAATMGATYPNDAMNSNSSNMYIMLNCVLSEWLPFLFIAERSHE